MATSTASISSSSAPPLLVIGAGSSVVTWDCRHDPSSNDDAIIQTFHPFGNNNTGEKIADLAWNHNGQGKLKYLMPTIYIAGWLAGWLAG